MNKSAVELKGDVKKIDKFIKSLPESVSEEAPSRVRDHLGGGYTLVYNSRTNRRIALDKLKKAGFKDSDFSGLSDEISIKKDAEVFKKAGVTDQKKQKEMVLKVLAEFVNPKDVIRGYEVNQTFNSTFKGSEREFKQLEKDFKKFKLTAKIDGKPKKDSIDFYVIGKRIDVRNAQAKLQRKYNISDFMLESVNEKF